MTSKLLTLTARRRGALIRLAVAGVLPATAFALAFSGPTLAQSVTSKRPPAPPYPLPSDPHAVILRWDSTGGMSPEPDEPTLLLHASGEFSARPARGSSLRRTGRLDHAAVQALLTDILERCHFTSLSTADIQAQISEIRQRTGRSFSVMDAGETRIDVRLPAVQHRVAMPALHAARSMFPEIEALQRLLEIQQRLLALANTAQ